MALRDIYFSLEDKYYRFLDKLDKSFPVYKIVDPIDKVFPSFILFSAIILLLIVFAILIIFPGILGTGESTLKLTIVDDFGNFIPDASVDVTAGEETTSYYSADDGTIEDLTFKGGLTVSVSVSKKDYANAIEEIELDKSVVEATITLSKETIKLEEKEYTLKLRDQLNRPIAELARVSFYCSGNAEAPEDITTTSGEVKVTAPADCGVLTASVSAKGFDEIYSIPITRSTQTITLKPSIAADAKGTLRVLVKFQNDYINEDIVVKAMRSDGAGGFVEEDEKIANGKPVSFELSPGTYQLKTEATSRFGSSKTDSISVEADETRDVTLNLRESIIGKIKIRIVDEFNNIPLDHAFVVLKLGDAEVQNAYTSTAYDRNGTVEFNISEEGTYSAIVTRESYCYAARTDLAMLPTINIIKLKEFGIECAGAVQVKVIDETGKNVPNALTTLYTEDGYSAGFEKKITNTNGDANFVGIPSGKYKAFAFKGSISGWSDAGQFNSGQPKATVLTTTLVIPNSKVKIRIVDEYRQPLQFAEVALVDTFDGKYVGGGFRPVEDENGTIVFDVKADKKVYVMARKPDYANYTSAPFDLIPNSTKEIELVLLKEIISGDAQIKFEGLYKNDELATILTPNEEYDAIFRLLVPTGKDYSKLGMHFRTGNSNIMEKDKIFIKDIYVPATTNIMKSTSFNPPDNYDLDRKSITNEDSKWVNIEWQKGNLVNAQLNETGKLPNGIIEVKAKVQLKSNVLPEDELPIYYRGYAVSNNQYLRDPIDEELGTSENSASKAALYAKTYIPKIYQTGTETLCTDKFCYSATIIDIDNGIAQNAPETYPAKIFKPYKLNFTIVNHSQFDSDIYPNALLKISNPDETIKIRTYTITGAQNGKVSGTIDSYSTDWQNAGNINLKDSISASMEFSPQKSGSGTMLIQAKSLQRIIFEKVLTINTEAANELAVTVSPEMLASGAENEITVTVKDAKTGIEQIATIKILDKAKNVLITTQASSLGIAKIKLPGQKPGEKLALLVEKPDYKLFEKQLTVEDKIIELPPALGLRLNPKNALNVEKNFTIKNLTGFELKIKSMKLEGDFKGYLERSQMNAWLSSYNGTKLSGKESSVYALKAILSEMGKRIESPTTLDASLEITVEGFDSEWAYTVPVKISLGLGEKVDDPACFTINKTTWTARTENKPVSIEFEIQNNCTSDGNPIILKNVTGKVLWKEGSNHIGTFSFKTANFAAELRAGYPRQIMPSMEQGKIAAVLTFTPDNGVNGEAKADIIFEASNLIDSGNEVLGGETSGKISASIMAIALEQCITIDKDSLNLKKDSKDTINIETKNCGIPTEIKLDSDLKVSQARTTMQSKDKKEIEVLAEKNYPGMYPIFVYAKSLGDTDFKILKVVRATIQPDGCISLSKYEFDIYDDPNNQYDGFDTAQLINSCYNEMDKIKITLKANKWGNALKYAFAGALIGWVGSGKAGTDVANMLKAITLKKPKPATPATNTAIPAETTPPATTGTTSTTKSCAVKIDPDKETVNVGIDITGKIELTGFEKTDSKNSIVKIESILTDLTKIDPVQCTVNGTTFTCKTGGFETILTNAKVDNANYKVNATVEGVTCVGSNVTIAKKEVDLATILTCEIKSTTAYVEPTTGKYDIKIAVTYKNFKITPRAEKINCSPGDAKKNTCEGNGNCEFICGNYSQTNNDQQLNFTPISLISNEDAETTCTGSATATIPAIGTAPPPENAAEKTCTLTALEIINSTTAEIKTVTAKFSYNNIQFENAPPAYLQILLNDKIIIESSTAEKVTFDNKKNTGTASVSLARTIEPVSTIKIQNLRLKIDDTQTITCDGFVTGTLDFSSTPAATGTLRLRKLSSTDNISTWEIISKTDQRYEILFKTKLYTLPNFINSVPASANFKPTGTNSCVIKPTANSSWNCEEIKISTSSKYKFATFCKTIGCPSGDVVARYAYDKIAHGTLSLSGASNISSPTAFAPMDSSAMGGLLGPIVSGPIASIVTTVFGTPNPWTYGLVGGLIGYFTAKDVKFEKGILEQDVVVEKTSLLIAEFMKVGSNLQEAIAKDIDIKELDKPILEPRIDDPTGKLQIEKRDIAFVNSTSVVQKDPIMPIFRIMKVEGKRPDYVLEYVDKTPEDYKLEEKTDSSKSSRYAEKFHLVFNSYKALDCVALGQSNPFNLPICPSQETPNCVLGNMVGNTGESALPKVKFEWKWDSISANACDESNNKYIYCDSTQFTIEMLQKLEVVKKFVENNSPSFKCPTGSNTQRLQSLSDTSKDVGITKLQVLRNEEKATVSTTVENTNGMEMKFNILVSFADSAGKTVKECNEQDLLVKTKTVHECVLEKADMDKIANDSVVDVSVEISPKLCAGCENAMASNDSLSTEFTKGELGVSNCEPYSISADRLREILEASGSIPGAEEALKNLNFNSFLIRDGYTNDFKADFDDYAKNKSFFNTPAYYAETEGIGRIFNSEKFKFDYPGAPYGYVEAGKYNVQLSIDFNNSKWNFFENGQPDVAVTVKLRELQRPLPDSPFYYMPFDGRIGLDSENGRQGYGVNFRESSPKTLKINKSAEEIVTTTNVEGSTPVFGGWIQAGINNNFQFVNVDNRGILLDVQKLGQGDTQMVLSQSKATPVILQITRTTTEKATAFYSIELDNSPQTDSPKLIPWNGIGFNCRDFSDNAVLTNFQNTYDLPALNSMCAKMSGDKKNVSYGLEWCSPTRSGIVSLESVIFTPQDKKGILKILSATDSASLSTIDGTMGSQVDLGTGTAIDSVQSIFDKVAAGDVCIVGMGNRNASKFFWNAANLLNQLESQRKNAEKNCIGTVQTGPQ